MRVVMGIDAAWTMGQPSGVALAAGDAEGWRLLAAESSYQRFLARAIGREEVETRPSGSSPDVPALISAARVLAGGPVGLVAVDMPLALSPIVGRRASDNAVSRHYGTHKCGTHTPSALRPGQISDRLREDLHRAGFPLQATSLVSPGLIEVYPHPALIELASASVRLPYKAAKIKRYWPADSPSERRVRLYQEWAKITELLEGEIAGVSDALPKLESNATGWQLKAHEDALDAVVCAWVATCALEARARPFGDKESAIWIPARDSASRCSRRPSDST